ncbi:MAG: alpha/beta hydrolase [Desertifilum sp.]|nr:alpha/beta hydrolase [Desertifilum sp.]
MFSPPGFAQHSVVTSLGTMIYYTAEREPWKVLEKADSPLIFFHGFGGGSSSYEWSKVYPAFASEYRVLAPDLLGWGYSDHPERDYKIDDYLTTLQEFIEKTSEQPIIAIASSLTAAFMVRVAIRKPDLFKGLILATPSGLADFGEDTTRSFFTQIVKTPIVDRLVYNVGIATTAGVQGFLENAQFAQSSRIFSEIVDAYVESAQQPNAEYAALSFVRGDLSFDLSNYIQQLTVPTAIFWGTQTQFTSADVGKRLAALNSLAIKEFQLIEDVGLTPQLELPAVTIGVIRRWLRSLF